MIDFQVSYDKLCNFETADEIRAYFNSIGVKGLTCNSSKCPIASFISEQSDEQVLVEPHHIVRASGSEWKTMVPTTEAMQDFICAFDDWCYPELIHEDEKNL